MTRRHPNVVHFSEVSPFERQEVGEFGGKPRILGRAAGSRELGCSLYEVPAGKVTYPFHWHASNEEAIIVIDGEGTMRIGDKEVDVGPGDYVAFPVGPEHAHQLRAKTDMRYYCISTTRDPEVCGYPDSRKILAVAGAFEKPTFRGVFREESSVDYYDREKKAGRD